MGFYGVNIHHDESKLKILSKAISETSAENSAIANEVSEHLSHLEFGTKNLPQDIEEGLAKIIAILRQEGLSTTDLQELDDHMQFKKLKELKKAHEEFRLKQVHEKKLKVHAEAVKRLETIEKAVNQMEEKICNLQSDTETYNNDPEYDISKSFQYEEAIKNLEDGLEALEVHKVLPDVINSKINEYSELLGENVQLDEHLNRYGGLPPNILQARAMREEKSKECERLKSLNW